jgi:tetratricopeptide (TPR) repeat protein
MFDSRKEFWLGLGLIAALTIVAYLPALNCGYVWDDDLYVTENARLKDLPGLARIWFEPTSGPQYYPLTFTTFWAEYQLWKLHPLGYHLNNVLLQAATGVLVWIVLRRLDVPGAWLAGAIFAVHPVHVESVAWITERKNVLSGVFYFSSLLAYLRFAGLDQASGDPPVTDRARWYWLALGLFACALLAKTVTCTLPVAILLLIWWKRGQVERADITALVPFFALSLAMGLVTAWVERSHTGAVGEEYTFTIVERCLIAGRIVWFYAGKLLWPANLTFIYPRWEVDAGAWWQYLFPLGVAVVVLALWLYRRAIGRGPLTAVWFFLVTIAPALWFISAYFTRYSFVGDHFQYLASVGLIALFAAVLTASIKERSALRTTSAVLLILLALVTWHQQSAYKNEEALWRDTVRKNPGAWMAHYNLGGLLMKQGRAKEAAESYLEAIKAKPDWVDACVNLGGALSELGRSAEAIHYYSEALRMQPEHAVAHNNLGIEYATQGKWDDAIRCFSQATKLKPDYADAYHNWGMALEAHGDLTEAVAKYSEAIRLKADFAEARYSLVTAQLKRGEADAALAGLREVMRLRPTWLQPATKLAWLLATTEDDKLRDGREAVALAEKIAAGTNHANPFVLDTLAAAYAEVGRFPDATNTAEKAMGIAATAGQTNLAANIKARLELYRKSAPYREKADR